jgi:ribose transport system substrate-binding protein
MKPTKSSRTPWAIWSAVCVAVALALAVSACGSSVAGSGGGSSGGGSSGGGSADAATSKVPVALVGTPKQQVTMASVCKGSKKDLNVGFSWGFEANGWRKEVLAELMNQAKQCPLIKKVTVETSNFNLQTQISQINSLVSQGANPIIVMTDGGPGLVPAMQKAVQAGVTVMAFADGTTFPAKPGVDDYASTTEIDQTWGQDWGEWVAKVLHGKGNVVTLGGPAGNPITISEYSGFNQVLKKYPGIHDLTPTPAVTNWDPAMAQQAMAGLLTKYHTINAVVTDYGATALAAWRAFQAANRPLVPTATLALNGVSCAYKKLKPTNPNLEVMTISSRAWMINPALRRAVAVVEGSSDPEPAEYKLPILSDTTDPSKPLTCVPYLASDLDTDTTFSLAQMKKLFG